MQKRIGVLWLGFLGMLLPVAALAATPKTPSKVQSGQSLVIVFKDGHQQSIDASEVDRIEFKSSAGTAIAVDNSAPGRGHFLGKWELGQGNGSNFYVTLDANGQASKSIGNNPHGTWTVVNGEARITWDENSYDAIRKVGGKFLKFWYPDGNFSGKPNNVAGAEHIESKPI